MPEKDTSRDFLEIAKDMRDQNKILLDHLVLFLVSFTAALETLAELDPEFVPKYKAKYQEGFQQQVQKGNPAALELFKSALENLGRRKSN